MLWAILRWGIWCRTTSTNYIQLLWWIQKPELEPPMNCLKSFCFAERTRFEDNFCYEVLWSVTIVFAVVWTCEVYLELYVYRHVFLEISAKRDSIQTTKVKSPVTTTLLLSSCHQSLTLVTPWKFFTPPNSFPTNIFSGVKLAVKLTGGPLAVGSRGPCLQLQGIIEISPVSRPCIGASCISIYNNRLRA